MRRLISTATVLLALASSALGQAIAEGVITHGAASSASAGAGKAMGGIVNQLAGRLGQQTSNAIHPAVKTVRPGIQRHIKIPQNTTTAATPPPGGSLIASVQGGEPQQPESNCASRKDVKASGDAQKPSNCASPTKLPAAQEQADHPSEITLPAAK